MKTNLFERVACIVCAVLAVQGCASRSAVESVVTERAAACAAVKAAPVWFLHILGAGGKVSFHGVANLEMVDTPETSWGGDVILAAIGSATVRSARDRRYAEAIEAADRVLQPYRSVLDRFTTSELLRSSIAKTAFPDEKRPLTTEERTQFCNAWIITSEPVILMTQDQTTLVLGNMITIRAEDSAEHSYKNIVKIVSRPISNVEPVAWWTAQDGARLKEQSAAMVAESIDVAWADMQVKLGGKDSAQQTVRYFEGGAKKVERAQVIREACGRIVMRTLRGGLMIVPSESGGAEQTKATCRASYF